MRKSFLFVSLLLMLSVWATVQAAVVRGSVVDTKGKPVSGVVVTDGYHFTTTDAKGAYNLDSDLDKSRLVYISVPADYVVSTTDGMADQFYRPLNKNREVNVHDFVLQKRSKPLDEFVYLAISDPQVYNEKEIQRLRTETVPDLKETVNRYAGKEIYGMVLGDLVGDAMDLFIPYKQSVSDLGICVFSVIGNHDHNERYTAESNIATSVSSSYAEQVYEHYFGPYNYSVNIGNVHIVTLKDIDYFGKRKYKERFGAEQLEWLKKDLSYVKPGTTVFVNVHAPAFNRSAEGNGNADDAEAFKKIVEPYNVHIFAGHTHYFENNQVTPTLFEHNIGAACGAWWAGHVNRCGAPNGYLVVEVKGDKVVWHYKATGRPVDYQFRVYRPGAFKASPDYLVANVWDWDPSYVVKWFEDGTEKGKMEQFDAEDQDYIDMHGGASGYHTLHLFRCQPSKGTKTVRVEVTNRFGEVYKEEIAL